MPLSKIALQMPNGQIITLAVDAKVPFTATEAASYTTTGTLKIRIIQPLSDRQLDSLVSKYETVHNGHGKGTNGSNGSSGSNAHARRKEKTSSAKIMELLSDTDTDSDHPTNTNRTNSTNRTSTNTNTNSNTTTHTHTDELQHISSMLSSRDALEDTYRDISDKEGLTDDELVEQRRKLNKMTNKLNVDVYKDIVGYRGDIVSSVLDNVNDGNGVHMHMGDTDDDEDEYLTNNGNNRNNGNTNIQVTRALKKEADTSKQIKIQRYESKNIEIQRLLARAVEVREELIEETESNGTGNGTVTGTGSGYKNGNGIAGNESAIPTPMASMEPEVGTGVGVGASHEFIIGATDSNNNSNTNVNGTGNGNDDSAVLISSIPTSIPQTLLTAHNTHHTGNIDNVDNSTSNSVDVDDSMQSFHIHSPHHALLHENDDVTLHGTMNPHTQGTRDNIAGNDHNNGLNDTNNTNASSVEDRYGEYRATAEDSMINVNNCSDVVAGQDGQDSFNVTNNSIKSDSDSTAHVDGDVTGLTGMTGVSNSNNIHSFDNASFDTNGTDGMYITNKKLPNGNYNTNNNNTGMGTGMGMGTGDSIESFDDSVQSSLQSGPVRRYSSALFWILQSY